MKNDTNMKNNLKNDMKIEMNTQIVEIHSELNMIVGQSHFIKTVEDIYEAIISSVPNPKFAVAFCEASGPGLIRSEGTTKKLKNQALKIAKQLSCGHVFVIIMEDMFPINILPVIKQVPEVCRIFCATDNPTQFIIAETKQGRGILGVIDGMKSVGIEKEVNLIKLMEH